MLIPSTLWRHITVVELSSVWSRDLDLFRGRVAKEKCSRNLCFFVCYRTKVEAVGEESDRCCFCAFPAVSGPGIGSG